VKHIAHCRVFGDGKLATDVQGDLAGICARRQPAPPVRAGSAADIGASTGPRVGCVCEQDTLLDPKHRVLAVLEPVRRQC
jgi:hypothetical protein